MSECEGAYEVFRDEDGDVAIRWNLPAGAFTVSFESESDARGLVLDLMRAIARWGEDEEGGL